jgi:putative acetyltransferase
MSVSIRSATAADSPSIVRVVRTVYDEYRFTWEADGYHADLYDLDGHYLSQGHNFWVAQSPDGGILGTAALELFPALPGAPGATLEVSGEIRLAGCDCSLHRLYVHPAARRQGVGQALMETVLEEARRRGRSRLEIWSDKRFGDAHRLYRRFGAVEVGERISHDPDESPEWGLLIDLSTPRSAAEKSALIR